MADYTKHNVEELRRLASDRGITGRSEMLRDDLIAALEAADQAESDMPATVAALQQEVQQLQMRVTNIEIGLRGDFPTDPVPQRR